MEEQRARRKRNHKPTKQVLYAMATGMVLYMYFKHATRGVIHGACRRAASSPHNRNPRTCCLCCLHAVSLHPRAAQHGLSPAVDRVMWWVMLSNEHSCEPASRARATDSNGDGKTGEFESHGWMHDHWRGATHRLSHVRHTVRESGTSAALEDAGRQPAEEQLHTFATGGLPTPHAQEEEEEEEEEEERAKPEEAETEQAEEPEQAEEAEDAEEPEDVDGAAVGEDDDNHRVHSQVVQETVPMDPAPPPPVAEEPVAEEEDAQPMKGAKRLVPLQTPPKCAHDAHGAPFLWRVCAETLWAVRVH